MFTGFGGELHLMDIGCFAHIVFPKMPKNTCGRVTMRQLEDRLSKRSIQLFGDSKYCPGEGVDKLHGGIGFASGSTLGGERGRRPISGMLLLVVPLPRGGQLKPRDG